MTLADILLIAAAGFTAGAVNAIAGGGTFFTFGALSAIGLPPVTANATSAFAVVPGQIASTMGYLKEIRAGWRRLLPMSLVSGVGGLAGAWLLLRTDNADFKALVPWLLLAATGLFAFSPWIARWTRRLAKRHGDAAQAHRVHPGALALQGGVSIYGGYFGAGMGIMMLAGLALTEGEDFHNLNAAKNLLAVVLQGLAVVLFISSGIIAWPQALVVTLSAIAGGWIGVIVARRLPLEAIRWFVIVTGLLLAGWYLWG